MQRFPIIRNIENPSPQEYSVEKSTRMNAQGKYHNTRYKNSGAPKFSGYNFDSNLDTNSPIREKDYKNVFNISKSL